MVSLKFLAAALVLLLGAMGFAAITQIFLSDPGIGLAAYVIMLVLVWMGVRR